MYTDLVASTWVGCTLTDFVALLLAMRPDKGDQLQQHLRLPRSPRTAERGSRGDSVCQLRLPRMCIERLRD